MTDRYLLKLLASLPIACFFLILALLSGAAIALSMFLILPITLDQYWQQHKQLKLWLQYLTPKQQIELVQQQQIQNYWMQIQQILHDSKRYAAVPVQWMAELAYVDVMNLNPFVWVE